MKYSKMLNSEIDDAICKLFPEQGRRAYCSDYSAAFVKIIEQGITVIQLMDGSWAAISRFKLDKEGNPVKRYSYTCQDPLRAAMIVFLMEKENATV